MATDTRTLRVVVTGDSTGAQKALGNVNKSAQDTQTHTGNLAKGIGSFAVKSSAAFLGVAGAAGALGVKTAAGFEQAHVGFTTMLGSGKKADAFISDLSKFAATTPFAFPDLVQASQRMLAMGFAAKDIQPTLTAAGDAVAAMGGGKEQIDQVTMALGQMKAKGKIAGDEVLQLTEAGIPAIKILAAQYGKTPAEMQKMISKGQVLADDAIPKLVSGLEKGTTATKGFGGMMANQSKTLVGQWSNLQDTVTTGLGKVIAPFIPMISKGTGAMTGFIHNGLEKLANFTTTKAVPAIEKFKKQWDDMSSGTFGGTLHSKLKSITSAIAGFFKGGTGDGGSKIKEAFTSIGDSLAKLKPLFDTLMANLPSFQGTINLTADAFKWLASHTDTLRKLLPYIIAGFIAYKTAQAAANIAAAASIPLRVAEVGANIALSRSQNALAAQLAIYNGVERVGMLGRLKNIAVTAGQTAAMIAQKVATFAVSAASKAWAAAQWLVNAAMSANPIGLVIAGIALLVAGVIYAWTHFAGFRNVVLAVWGAIKTATQAVAAWFMSYVWPIFKSVFNFLVSAVITYFTIYKTIFNAVRSVISAVVNWFRNTAWPIVQTAFNLIKGAVTTLWDKWKSVFDLIKSKVETVMDAAKTAFSNAKDAIGTAWAKLGDLARNPVNFVIKTVYNEGILKFWNAIASKVNLPQLAPLKTLATGGGIDGHPSIVGDHVPLFGQAGEYMLNRKQVAKAGGWRAIEAMFGEAGRDGASTGHYASGGGIVGGLSSAGNWLKDKASGLIKGSILNIAQPLIDTIRKAITQIPGTGDIANAVRKMPTNMLDAFVKWIKPKDVAPEGDGALGGPLGSIGVIPDWVKAAKAHSSYGRNSGIGNWLFQVVKAAGLATSNQGIFQVRHTATGNLSMHGYGRAVDLPAKMAIFNFLRSHYGSQLKELIFSPAGNSQIYNGRNHFYTGITRAMHFNHVHASYDDGGILPPGVTIAHNNTGRNEYVNTEPFGAVTVNVTVQGNVTAEKDLAESIATAVRDALLRKAARNGGKTGLT